MAVRLAQMASCAVQVAAAPDSGLHRCAETVVCNPPFGTWCKGADIAFLEAAVQVLRCTEATLQCLREVHEGACPDSGLLLEEMGDGAGVTATCLPRAVFMRWRQVLVCDMTVDSDTRSIRLCRFHLVECSPCTSALHAGTSQSGLHITLVYRKARSLQSCSTTCLLHTSTTGNDVAVLRKLSCHRRLCCIKKAFRLGLRMTPVVWPAFAAWYYMCRANSKDIEVDLWHMTVAQELAQPAGCSTSNKDE
jgi:hypothetical protein